MATTPAIAAEPGRTVPDQAHATFTPTLRLLLRPEARTNAGVGRDPAADAWAVHESVRVGVTARYRALTAVGQLQDVRAWGHGNGTGFSNNPFTGLHQGYVEVGGGQSGRVDGWLRVGRQEIVYGSRRHFHRAPWHPAGQAFDAARGHLDFWRASLELSYVLLDAPETFDVIRDDGTQVEVRGDGDHVGYADVGYDFHDLLQIHVATIFQWLGSTQGDPSRERFFVMPGGRVTGTAGSGLSYDAEGWLQRGTERSVDLQSWMAAASIAYKAPIEHGPGARVHYEILSGSACAGDPDADEPCGNDVHRDFDQLDGARHLYRGWMDLMAGSNLRDLAVSAFVSPSAQLDFVATYHFFQLHAASGRWFRIDGESTWGRGWDPTNTNHNLGHEIDVQLDYRPLEYLRIRPGYAVFVRSAAARNLLPLPPAHFVYLWGVVNF
ncbi:MAG: alginate export family protein [Nannocystaceae bacterium]|nr:alginate export family protein [bacterium]